MPGIPNIARGNGMERRSVAFRFFPQGNSATPYTNAAGTLVDKDQWLAAAARDAVGRYALTMSVPVQKVLSIQVTVQNVTDVDPTVKIFDILNEGNGSLPLVFRVVHNVAGVAAEMAANANNSIMVTIEFEAGR